MKLLDLLSDNKGTVSSALSKQLAKDVLAGDVTILNQASILIHHDSKSVRSGAAKIIEIVAEEKPVLLEPLLEGLIPALNYPEPQTRWMMIHTFGLCAKLQPELARAIFDTVLSGLEPTNGTCLRDRSVTYLGHMGSVSKADCDMCFPLLVEAFTRHPDRITRVFESLERLAVWFDTRQKQVIKAYADKFADSESAEIRKRVKSIVKKIS